MDKVWTLIRVFFRSGNSLTISSKKKNNYWLIPILVIGFLPLSFQIGFSAFSMTLFLQPIGAQSTVLHSGLISGAFVIFFFGLFYVLGVFYFSKDIEFILTLPLKAWQILSSKFVTVLVYEYLVMLVILLPFLIGYGLGIAAGPIYALYSALIFLVMPIIPLSLASMPILVIMRFTGFARNRDKFKYITGILALFLGIGVSIGMQRFAMVTYDETMIMEMLNGLTQTMEKISILIPGVNFAVKSLTEYNTWSGLLYLLLFFLSAGLIFLIFMALGKLLYFKGVIGINESSAKREKLDVESLNKNVYRKSIMNSYVLKEIRLLIRTPIYFLNCVMGNFLIPIFFIIPMVAQGDLASSIESLSQMASEYENLFLVAIFAFTMFLSTANAVTSTSISREGSNLFVMKYLPVPIERQIRHKVMSGFWLSWFAMILILGFLAYFKVPWTVLLLSLILSVNGILMTSMTGIIIDMHNPKLTWDSEQAAVKQNFNVMLNMLAALVAGGVVVVIPLVFRPSLVITAVYLFVVSTGINVLLNRYIQKYSTKLIMEME
jgi:ABC-2 type transport system permease protein